MSPTLQVIQGDCRAVLQSLPAASVQCCVTSPPYWGLRDYGVAGQIGLEADLETFLAAMVGVFEGVRRVLKPDGVAWVNLGDTYTSGGRKTRDGSQKRFGAYQDNSDKWRPPTPSGLKPKDLVGIPWRVAFALQAAGWYLRQDVIWHKNNPAPETIADRCTKAHEYIFLLSKSRRYYWDKTAATEPVSGGAHARGNGVNPKAKLAPPASWDTGPGGHGKKVGRYKQNASWAKELRELTDTRNWRSVWKFPTEAWTGAHYATFPQELPRRCILAATRPGDTVLDPFAGSGTTGKVALEMGRSAILIELNPEYIRQIRERTNTTPGLAI